MKILGICGGPNTLGNLICDKVSPYNFHDSSATLLVDGKVECAIEEERISRVKHTNFFPINAINYCLNSKNLLTSDIDFFTFSIDESFLDKMLNRLGYDLKGKNFIQLLLSDILDVEIDVSKIKLVNHHYAHAASAFYQSGFEESIILTLDGIGDGLSGSISKGNYKGIEQLRTIKSDDSLGNFYTFFTDFLGFKFFDEYKVMGLASYGNAEEFRTIFQDFYELKPDGNYIINNYNFKKLTELYEKRLPGEKINSIHRNIAASLQESLEIIVKHIVSHFRSSLEIDYLSLSGGVALNSKLAGELNYSNLFKDIFVQPASGDNGLSLGSALAVYFEIYKENISTRLKSDYVYWGRLCSEDDDLENIFEVWSQYINFELCNDICGKTADYLSKNKVVGWIQGKSEFGPRALGNRSILADPRYAENKSKVNSIIKMREGFRPFAPSILEESVQDYFEIPINEKRDYPFMSFVLRIRDSHKKNIPAVVHVDGTSRVQTVNKSTNSRFWELINNFKILTNTPVLLNTSFNNHREPIVDSAQDAINCFMTTKLDALIIGDFFISKKKDILNSNGVFSICISQNVSIVEVEKKYYLFNSYSKNKVEVSREIKKLIEIKKVNFKSLEKKFKSVIFQLWIERIIILTPFR